MTFKERKVNKKRIKEIDKEIEELKEKLKNVKGTESEVHTRIVGYYRPVKNWNNGKRAEYNNRIVYKIKED